MSRWQWVAVASTGVLGAFVALAAGLPERTFGYAVAGTLLALLGIGLYVTLTDH